MSEQDDYRRKLETFRALHVPGRPLVLFNVWDAGSARAVAEAGAVALATGSWSVAAAHGYADGERLPLELALANLGRIAAATRLPISMDIESGYAGDPQGVAATISGVIDAGAVGCNIEDSFPQDGTLRQVADQVERVRCGREASDARCRGFFINARTDIFFQDPPERHDGAMVEEALRRARAYAAAGADGLFVPGLRNIDLIGRLAAESPLPVNIMASGDAPDVAALSRVGVARVSHGPGPYLLAMQALAQAARAALAAGA
jgi:2-methylisocitrate lyase-like PEP mutase family enzyme